MKRNARRLRIVPVLLAGAWAAAPSLVTGAAEPQVPARVLEQLRAASVFIGVHEPGTGRLLTSGSGFLVSSRGDILTTHHLASVPGELRVVLGSGRPGERRLPASVTRLDRSCDVALLKVAVSGASYLCITDSARLRETEPVTSAGFPLGTALKADELGPAPSFRTGTVTSLRRTRFGGLAWLEVSSAAESGSSGSPLVDAAGHVVGMVTDVAGRATVLAAPSRRFLSFAGDHLTLAERDRSTLTGWLKDPLEQAQSRYEMGRYPEARSLLLQVESGRRNSPRGLFLQAGIEERLGGIEAALAAYRRLLREQAADVRAPFWEERSRLLASYRGDGNPRNNLVILSPHRREAAVIDAGAGRVLELLRDTRFAPYPTYRSDGRYVYTVTPDAFVALDLVIPQEATHLRRDHPDLGTPRWASASRDGNVVTVGYSPTSVLPAATSVVVYRGPELRESEIHRLGEYVSGGYLTPDGTTVCTVRLVPGAKGLESAIRALDLETGAARTVLEKGPPVTWMAFAGSAQGAYGIDEDGRVFRFHLQQGTFAEVAAGEIHDLAPGPERGRIVMAGRELLVWDSTSERSVERFPLPFEAYHAGATADGKLLFAADGRRERLALVHRQSGRLTELRLHTSPGTDDGY